MKKNIFVISLLGAIALGTFPVSAENGTKEISASFRNIKVVADGRQLSMTAEPFLYNGTVYLPVRAVGEAVNMDISWDNASNTVRLDTPPPRLIVDPRAEERTDFALSVTPSGKKERTAIFQVTESGDVAMPPYTLYYYGLSEVSVTLDGQTLPLAEAMQSGLITPDDILRKGWQDFQNKEIVGYIYRDGGSQNYFYEGFNIIKYNELSGSHDFYICPPDTDIELHDQFQNQYSKFQSVQDVLDYYKSFAMLTERSKRRSIYWEGMDMIYAVCNRDGTPPEEAYEAIRQLAELCGEHY